jgi:hypothetical protein
MSDRPFQADCTPYHSFWICKLRAVRKEAAHPFDHSICLLPMRKMSGIGKGRVLRVRQHSEDCIQVPFGSELIVSALKDEDRTGDMGDEISKGRFPVSEFSDTGDPGGKNRIRVLVVLGKPLLQVAAAVGGGHAPDMLGRTRLGNDKGAFEDKHFHSL